MLTRTVQGRTYTYSHCIGRNAGGGPGFRYAMDVALDSEGVAYVINRGSEYNQGTRISKLAFGEDAGDEEFISEFGSYGEMDGQFVGATCIAIDDDDRIYVSDEDLNRISVFDKNGNFLAKWGSSGSEEGQLDSPAGIEFDKSGNLWVVDSGNSRVQAFTKDGKFLKTWGKCGTGEGELNAPWGVTVDDNGDVYVADWYNGRVQKFDQDGKLLMTFGDSDSGEGALRRPSDVAVDSEGDVYVVDWGESKVQVYAPDGTHITTFVGDAHELSKWGAEVVAANPDTIKARRRVKSLEPEQKFNFPTAVLADAEGHLVIVDQMRSRLQVYIKEKNYVDAQFNL